MVLLVVRQYGIAPSDVDKSGQFDGLGKLVEFLDDNTGAEGGESEYGLVDPGFGQCFDAVRKCWRTLAASPRRYS